MLIVGTRSFVLLLGTMVVVWARPSLLRAETRYVWAGSPSDGPGTNWPTAFHTIQSGIDAVVSNDIVLVTNGVYATGGKAIFNGFINRVALDKPIKVQSVNGPEFTMIVGQGPMGASAVRCAYLTNGAVLSGFTLTNGATRTTWEQNKEMSGGGAWCGSSAVLSNCIISGSSASKNGGGVYSAAGGANAVLVDCVIVGNSAGYSGGGVYGGMLTNCFVKGNLADYSGGGAAKVTANACSVIANSAGYGGGGGADSCSLHYCSLAANSATNSDGGGAQYSSLLGCTLSGNSAFVYGGGVARCQVDSCTIVSNQAQSGAGVIGGDLQAQGPSHLVRDSVIAFNIASGSGGGACGTVLRNCNLASNAAGQAGGGADSCVAVMCRISSNTAGSGGGVSRTILSNCVVMSNSALTGGGADNGSSLVNCLVASNSAQTGGGVHSATLQHSTVAFNVASSGGGGICNSYASNSIVFLNSSPTSANWATSELALCCTYPAPAGIGNLTNEPSFVNPSAGDFHLRYGSPCIDMGASAGIPGVTNDLAGTPRPLDGNGDGIGKPDMGAYEYDPFTADSSSDGIPDWWCRGYHLDPNAADVARGDPDGDAFTTLQEWIALTDPTNAASLFRIEAISGTADGCAVFFTASAGRVYSLRCGTNPASGGWSDVTGQTDIAVTGVSGLGCLTDAHGYGNMLFYRVRVSLP